MNTDTQHWDDDEIDLRELFLKLWNKRWTIIAFVMLCTAALTTVAYKMTPIYRATTVVIPANSERSSGAVSAALGQLGGLASLAGVSVGSSDPDTQEALAVLNSRVFTERFITEKNLMPKLYYKLWDSKKNTWKVDEEAQPTLAKAYTYFNTSIRTVTQDKKTGLITLTIDWHDRHEAAEWANELVQRLNAEMRARAIEKSEASMGYLDKELKTTAQIGTQEAINRLIEVQVKQRMLANVTAEYSFRVVDKALPADEDDPIKPKKLLMMVAGPFLGGFLGILWVLVAGAFKKPEQQKAV